MPTSPVIEWRSATTPFPVLSSLAFTGSGSGGAIPVGTNSNVQQVRIYNNFAAVGGIADATNCVLAAYDDTVHQGLAQNVPTTSQYVQVQVTDYNGSVTNQDIQYYAIGGQVKHAIPVNGGTLSGTGSNYVGVLIQISVPATAVQGAVIQGVWVEYSSTA